MTSPTSTATPGRGGGAQVLDSAACLERMSDLTAFENDHFGEGFAWSVEQNRQWAENSAAVHAAVVQDPSHPRIVASMSALLIHPDSCKQLVEGRIKEWEVQPWNEGARCLNPIIYFASVIAPSKADLPLLYTHLAEDIFALFQRHNLQAEEGLAIAAGEIGRQHLERNGFRRLGEARYLHQYLFMSITARHAKTPFWRRALSVPAAPVISPFSRPLFSTGSPFLA